MNEPSLDHSISAEQMLLGGLMLDQNAYWQIVGEVSSDDFSNNSHRLIFDSVRGLLDGDGSTDPVSISDWLSRDGSLDNAGGLSYIAGIANNTPSARNIKSHAKIVREYAKKRRAKLFLRDALSRIDDGEEFDSIVGSLFASLEHDATGGEAQVFSRILEETIASAENAAKLSGSLRGVSTTLPSLDRRTGGFFGGKLIVLGGRPGTFKSTLAWQILLKAGRQSIPTGMISLEMGGSELGARALAHHLKISGQALALGDRQSLALAKSAVSGMNGWPIFADYSASGIGKCTARILEWKHKHNVRLVVIDHAQLIDKVKGQNRHQDLSDFSRAMKRLAMKIETPIVLVSQISRSVEQENRDPQNSDLRESGDLEQNADLILFTVKTLLKKTDSNGEEVVVPNYKLTLTKHRGGPANIQVPLWVDGEKFRVGEVDDSGMMVSP